MNKLTIIVKNYYIELLLVAYFAKMLVMGGSSIPESIIFGIVFAYKAYNEYFVKKLIKDKEEILEKFNSETENLKVEIEQLRGHISAIRMNAGLAHKPGGSPFEPTPKVVNGTQEIKKDKRYF